MNIKLLVIGAGNLGGAILSGVLRAGKFKPEELAASDLNSEKLASFSAMGIKVSLNAAELASHAEWVLIAVKPAHVAGTLQSLQGALGRCLTLISVAAGVPESRLREASGVRAPIVRVMPNLPTVVGAGIAGLWSSSREAVLQVADLFQAVGQSVILDKEELLDPVTALSAGGPAFVARMIEGLVDGGLKMGLSRDQALQLTLGMFSGTLELMKKQGLTTQQIVDLVATPGGTTIHGLHEMERGAVKGHLIATIESSTKRAREFR
jgi:pyrroline-5-carboxylate reductase